MLSKLAKILKKLDVATDKADRLMGSDWLEERGYTKEASFYRWLVQEQLEPFISPRLSMRAYWLSPAFDTSQTDQDNNHFAQSQIKKWSLWVQLRKSGHLTASGLWNYYPNRQAALRSLRRAYIRNYAR